MKAGTRLLLLLIFCIQQNISCQTLSDTLVIRKIDREAGLYMFNKADPRDKAIFREARKNGFFVYQGKEKLFWSEVADKLKSNELASQMVKEVRNIHNLAFAFGTLANAGVGGYGIYASTRLSGNPSSKESLQQIGIIFGSLICAIIITNIIDKSVYKPAKIAIDMYNNDLKRSIRLHKPEIGLGLTRNGFGLVMKF